MKKIKEFIYDHPIIIFLIGYTFGYILGLAK
jgi:hypothetical protein